MIRLIERYCSSMTNFLAFKICDVVGFLVFDVLKFQHLCLWSWSIHSKGGIIAKKSFQLSKPQKPSFIRASTLVEEKNLAIQHLQSHFIYFNLPFHNLLHINVLIFPSELNTIHLFIIFSLSYSLSHSSSLFLLPFFNPQPPSRHNQTTIIITAQPNHNHYHGSLKLNQNTSKKKKKQQPTRPKNLKKGKTQKSYPQETQAKHTIHKIRNLKTQICNPKPTITANHNHQTNFSNPHRTTQ